MKHLSPLHKYEIANRFSSKSKLFLMQAERFYDFISPKLKNFINLVCDSVDEQCEEYMYEPMHMAIRLEYNDEVCISVVNIGRCQNFHDFGIILYHLLFDLIFNAQMIGNNGKIEKNEGKYCHTEYEQIQYVIDSSRIRKIVIDKDDEQ